MKKLSIVCLISFVAVPCFTATLTVDLNGAGDFDNIAEAVNATSPGDTVLVNPGTYEIAEPIVLENRNISLEASSDDARDTTIKLAHGVEQGNILTFINDRSSVVGLTLFRGKGSIRSVNGSRPVIVGGGVIIDTLADIDFHNCVIKENRAEYGGGVYVEQNAYLRLHHCRVELTSADWYGGGIYSNVGAVIDIYDSLVHGNIGQEVGGALYLDSAWLTAENTKFNYNRSGYSAAGIYLGSMYQVEIRDCEVSLNNSSSDGWVGGVYVFGRQDNCLVFIENTDIMHNRAGAWAGLYCCDNAAVDIIGCNISHNENGGIAAVESQLIIDGSTVSNNVFHHNPGGISFHRSWGGIVNTRIVNNIGGTGGGLYIYESSPWVRDCVFEGNLAQWGGGVAGYLADHPTFYGCSFIGNLASDIGGGIMLVKSKPKLKNCVIAGNRARRLGGINFPVESNAELVACTITNNHSETPYPIFVSSGSISMTNCIFWDSTLSELLETTPNHHVTHSCLEQTIGVQGEGNIPALPKFVSEGKYNHDQFKIIEVIGAPYAVPDFIVEPPDLKLKPTSPCIDTGLTLTEARDREDILGNRRPANNGFDIGAYEFIGIPLTLGDSNRDGYVDISDAVFILRYLFGEGPEPNPLEVADANSDETIDISDVVFLLRYLFQTGPAPGTTPTDSHS